MASEAYRWLPLVEAAKHFGYGHTDSLRNRLRQLRRRGRVVDLGNPPPEYTQSKSAAAGKIVLFWANPNTALLRSDAPAELLVPKRGKRALGINS